MRTKSIKDSAAYIGVGRTTFYDLLKRTDFPQPVEISDGRKAMVVAELDSWLDLRIAERDARIERKKLRAVS